MRYFLIIASLLFWLGNTLSASFAQNTTLIVDNFFNGSTVIDASSGQKTLIQVEDGRVTRITPVPTDYTAGNNDVVGLWATPGLFSPFSRVGLVEVAAEDDSDDRGASQTDYSVSLRASDGFNPAASAIAVTRLEGVTHIALAPTGSSNIFAGQGGVASTSGAPDSLLDNDSFVFVRLGEAGARLSGGSRASSWAFFRAALRDARTYPGRYTTHADGGEALVQEDANALKKAARGDQKLLVSVDRAQDIRQVLELTKGNSNLDIVLVGAAEGHLVADEIAEAGVPVIIDPSQNLPSRFEMVAASFDNAQKLIEAGVLTAFAVFDDDAHQSRLLPQISGIAVSNGVAHEDALAAITTIPAEIFGQPNLGRIALNQRANLVVWDRDPLELSSRPIAILIDGTSQPLASRQTELRDRYLKRLQEIQR